MLLKRAQVAPLLQVRLLSTDSTKPLQSGSATAMPTASGHTGDSASGAVGNEATNPTAQLNLEERVARLEAALEAQEKKLAEVEKLAKRRGIVQLIVQYGAPFAIWYGVVWVSMWLGIYTLLELGLISWQDSIKPLLEGLGLGSYSEQIDPSYGNLIIAFLVNECIEPIRLPFVIATGTPMIKAVRRITGRGAAMA